MKLRIRIENLVIDLGQTGKMTLTSTPDKVINIPDVPVPDDKVFKGKQLFFNYHAVRMFESIIILEWGFKGLVALLQKKLLDDLELDSASIFNFIDIDPLRPRPDTFHAFLNGVEVPMKGQSIIIVER
jgi:hypothetical protein